MKKNILFLLTSLFFVMTANVQAQEWCDESSCCDEDNSCFDKSNFYAKIFGGANFLQNSRTGGNKSSYQTGYTVAGSLGYSWCYGLRLEAEYAFRRNALRRIHFVPDGSSKHGHFQVSSYMANLLWDLPISLCGCALRNIQSFIGAGIGYDVQRVHSSNSRVVFKQKRNQFAWQAMAGLTYPIFCNTEISLEYKFHRSSSHFYHHAIGVGLAYKFGFLRKDERT